MSSIIFDRGVMIIENAFGDQFVNDALAAFQLGVDHGLSYTREPEGELFQRRKDVSVSLNTIRMDESEDFRKKADQVICCFNKVFWEEYYSKYVETYPSLQNMGQQSILDYKVQKTVLGEGYHIWHAERCSMASGRRIAVYTYYLNDIDEGGETEFLYLHKRIKARKDRLCIFPADYLYTHRGNPPLNTEKVLMTGWIELR